MTTDDSDSPDNNIPHSNWQSSLGYSIYRIVTDNYDLSPTSPTIC